MNKQFLLGVAIGVALCIAVGGVVTYGPEILEPPVAQAKKRQNKAAQPASKSPKTRLPNGRQLMPIRNGVYPQDFFPNTEKLGPNEMRIIALGTGMPQVIQKKTKASGWYVELGNGEKFLFDLGTGSTENLAALQPDWSQVDKVFLSHLHSDHAGDFAPLYIGGWMNGRYTPLHIYGPTGSKPELGTKAFVENQVKAWAWDIEGRKGSFPDNGGRAEVQEFDYKKVQVIYDKNGVKVTQFPAIHALDGSVSFRMDWGKRSFVFGGDSAPNNWYIKHAKGAEIAVHECFYTPEGLAKAMDIDMREAVVSELALPTGTTKGYLEAFRSKVDANSKISEYLSSERWKGFKPPPLPE